LWKADLSGADFREANLRGVGMRGALLWGTTLSEADLSSADLSEADLNIRTELPSVAMKGLEDVPRDEIPTEELTHRAEAVGKLSYEEVTNLELEYQAKSLEGATMPNGQKYEEWLKHRENSDS
jgi:hypothetical protein